MFIAPITLTVVVEDAPVPFTTWVNRGVSKANWIKWMGLMKSCQSNTQTVIDDKQRVLS